MQDEMILALITVPDSETAEQIGNVLVEDGLAACVNIIPSIRSIYRWQGDIVTDSEVLLVCKTRRDLFQSQFVPLVKSLHPYEVPEILSVSIQDGLKSYLEWIRESTTS